MIEGGLALLFHLWSIQILALRLRTGFFSGALFYLTRTYLVYLI